MQVLAHNLAAQFTNRQLNITTDKKAKSSEKLSSGYKINRSADDAAGLSISEKMRKQIRGLNRASENVQDGISLCQVADGALGETTEILQRMRQLSVQAANGTNSESDRSAIQKEIDQLTEEVDRIADTTSFNQTIYPLRGENIDASKSPFLSIAYNSKDLVPGIKSQVEGDAYGSMVSLLGSYGISHETAENAQKIEDALNSLHLSYKEKYIVTTWRVNGNKAYLDIRQTSLDSYAMYSCICNGTVPAPDMTVAEGSCTIMEDGSYKLDFGDTWGYVCLSRTKGVDFPDAINQNAMLQAYRNSPQQGTIVKDGKYSMVQTSKSENRNQHIWIQAGADTGDGFSLSMVNATAKGLGIKEPDILVMSEANCDNAMNRLGDAIEKVSSYRSLFGAQQNRLECAKSVDDNTAENTTAAESRIRDTDMAEEMVNFSKNNILAQVGQSMLAQANQSTQGILSLLQ